MAKDKKHLSKIQCFQCKELGHYANNCKKDKGCNYCKEPEHLISEHRRQPQNQTASAYHARASSHGTSTSSKEELCKTLTPEMVLQIAQSSRKLMYSSLNRD